MSFLLNVFLNLLLLGSMLAFVAFGIVLSLRTADPFERLIRFGAMFAGALIVVGAKVGGVSFTEFILGALSETNPARGVAMVVGAAVTGSAGVGLGWYLTSRAQQSTNVAIRIMALVRILVPQRIIGSGLTLISQREIWLSGGAYGDPRAVSPRGPHASIAMFRLRSQPGFTDLIRDVR